MLRANISFAMAQMVICKDCSEIMNAIYSADLRDTCRACGGVPKSDIQKEFEESCGNKRAEA